MCVLKIKVLTVVAVVQVVAWSKMQGLPYCSTFSHWPFISLPWCVLGLYWLCCGDSHFWKIFIFPIWFSLSYTGSFGAFIFLWNKICTLVETGCSYSKARGFQKTCIWQDKLPITVTKAEQCAFPISLLATQMYFPASARTTFLFKR